MCGSRQRFSFIYLIAFALILLTLVQSTPIGSSRTESKQNKTEIVYRRYVRRRPPVYSDDVYVDEFMEVFNLKRKPPPYMLSDEEVDRLIRCDFDPSLKECKDLHKSQFPVTTTENIQTWTASPKSTRLPNFRPTESATDMTTMKDIHRTTTTSATSETTMATTTEDLPFLPDISTPEEPETTEPDYYVGPEDDENDNNEDYDEDDK